MGEKPGIRRFDISAPDRVAIPAILRGGPSESASDCIVMLHGITTHKNEFGNFFGRMAELFANAGLPSIRFDFRGHGESRVSSRQFSVASQVIDCMSVIQWLNDLYDKPRVHFLACSFGSPAAIFTASQQEACVRTLSMISPVLDYRRTFLNPESEWGLEVFNQEAQRKAFQTGFLNVNPDFQIDVKLLVEMAFLDPIAFLGKLTQRILLIHGEADSMVPFSISEEVANRLPSIKFLSYSNMEHGFTVPTDEDGSDPESQRNIESMATHVVDHIRSVCNGTGLHS